MRTGFGDRSFDLIAQTLGGGGTHRRHAEPFAYLHEVEIRARQIEHLLGGAPIGFTPTVLDGKVHKFDVTTRRGGMSVRARKNYVAVAEWSVAACCSRSPPANRPPRRPSR